MCIKTRRVKRSKTVNREITVRLDGYPEYDRSLSGKHPGNWRVEIVFKSATATKIITVAENEDYQIVYKRYEEYVRLVTD